MKWDCIEDIVFNTIFYAKKPSLLTEMAISIVGTINVQDEPGTSYFTRKRGHFQMTNGI